MYKFITGLFISVALMAASQCAWGTPLHLKPYTFKADNGTTVAAQWGTLEVPLRHEAKHGKTLRLSFVRFKSTNPHPGNPIVYLAGGPGGSGIDTARGNRFTLFMALRKVADVIALDQRGTGASNVIPACSATQSFPLDQPVTATTLGAYAKSAATHCVTVWQKKGIDLSAYNTRENALDLKSLRKALGAKKLNLWGISYGSQLALAALKLMPKQIGRVVLASPLDQDQTMRLPSRTQNFLARVAALVKANPKAGKVWPDLLGTMKAVLDRLATNPAHVTLPSPSGKAVTLTFGKFWVQTFTVGMIKDPNKLRYLPALYAAMAAGHFEPVVRPLYAYLSRPMTLAGMPLAVRAASCLSPTRARRIAEQAPHTLLGNALNAPTELFRSTVAVKRPGDAFCKPIHSNVPALVLTGTLDGRTYPAGHAAILKGLSNVSEVVIKNAGHDLFMSSPKVTDDIVEFFSHKPIKYPRINLPPPAFVVPAMPRPRAAGN
ncbi:MAG: alpha/beta hydrolase [Gammaproteobacteria bacterium]